MEDLQRALSERGLTISTLPEKGRCLFSTRDFSPEFQFPQDVIGVSSQVILKSAQLVKLFGTVGAYARYLKKLDWKLHRLECGALSKLGKDRQKSLTSSIRLMVKLYLRRKLQSEKIIPTTPTDNYSLVEALVSHMSDVDEKQLVSYAQMANLVNLILQLPDINIKEIAENFSKLACNAHTICDGELRPLGTGLYPVTSIINHSCFPNSVLVFERRVAVTRVVQHIPKGTEVLISYIETAGSTATRQKALKEQYFFSCTCPRCIKLGHPDDIQESASLEGYRCVNSRCNGVLLRDSGNERFICQQCGTVRDKEEIKKIVSKMNLLSEKASKLVSSGYNKEAIDGYKMIEKLQVKLCHPLSINLMRTRETLLKIFMEMQDWKEALVYCRLTIPVYQRVYPGYHPLLGLQYYTCGKLEWLLEDTENAITSLTKAVDILRITHGTNTPFMKELFNKLEEAHAEASYKLSSKNG